MSGLEKACRIRQTANGDWVISPPEGVRLYIEGDTRIHEHLSYHFRPDIHGRNIVTEQAYISRVTPIDNDYRSIVWSPELGLFAAISDTGTNNRVMTSPDGINWTIRVTPTGNDWHSMAWSPELGLFAAVSNNGANDRVMTSPDGINWTDRVTPGSNNWRAIAWSPELGLFAAVSHSGSNDRAMTSPDGINWTIRVTPVDRNWYSIVWSPELGLFAAVSYSGTNDRVMTSPDGINWTIRATPVDNNYCSIVWSPELGLFAAVSYTGTNDRVMTSPDGINWTIRVTPVDNNWHAIAWSPELGLFAAASDTGTNDRVMTSPDGINWTVRVTPVDNNWYSMAWSPELGLFAAVSYTGTDDRIMTSACGRSRIQQNAADDWQILPPAGQITRVGETIGAFVPPATNDDLLISGRLAAFGPIQAGARIMCAADSEVVGENELSLIGLANSENLGIRIRSEEITIPVGSGAAGVLSALGMFQNGAIVLMVYARVIQAPGGGATTFSIYRTGTPADKLILDQAVAVDGIFNSANDSDGTHDGPFFNPTVATLTVITDVNVTGSDMKIRVGVSYIQLWNFES